ncbi:MAG: MYXO-CTERM sorting domain-containing protein [Kofleriaceae bacterium]
MRFVVLLIAMTSVAAAQGVTVKTTTTDPPGANYKPHNADAIWIETCPDPPACTTQGTFVKSCGHWANARKQYLIDWIQQAGNNDVDGISQASQGDHSFPIQCTWDLKQKDGTEAPDATYRIRLETAESDTNSAANNNEGLFTFVKGPNPQVQTNLSNGGFINTTISYAAAPGCGNGVVDPGEACDGATCPTTCEASANACMPNVLVGSAASCTAACQVQLVTSCHDDDMCCPIGCTADTDNDCGKAGTSNGDGTMNANNGSGDDNNIIGGCNTTNGTGLMGLLLFGSAVFVVRRKRF